MSGGPAGDWQSHRHLFDCLAEFDRIVLAGSGGLDSTFLLHAAAAWHRLEPDSNRRLLVCTVDHRLRPESTAEADAVGRQARALGLDHVVAPRTGPAPEAFSQAWARTLRYQLLIEVARNGARASDRIAVVTAHHADDQVETVLMRLDRGSGITGLAGMRPARVLAAADSETGEPAVTLVRPLLSKRRQDLRVALVAAGIAWFDDPSNVDPRFERVRLRNALSEASAPLVAPAGVAGSTRRLARADDALDELTNRLLDAPAVVTTSPLGYARLNLVRLRSEPAELRLRVAMQLMRWLSAHPLSLGQLEAHLGPTLDLDLAGSLHHVQFKLAGHGMCLVLPERGRLAVQTVAAGGPRVRFAAFDCVAGLDGRLGPLGKSGLDQLAGQGWTRPANVPHAVLLVQPALFCTDGLLRSAPSLGFHVDRLRVRLRPLARTQRSGPT